MSARVKRLVLADAGPHKEDETRDAEDDLPGVDAADAGDGERQGQRERDAQGAGEVSGSHPWILASQIGVARPPASS